MAPPQEFPTERRHVRRITVAGMLLVFVAAAIATLFAIPDDANEKAGVDTLQLSRAPTTATMLLTVDSLDANRGLLHVRVQAVGGTKLPPEGVTLLTSVGAIPTITILPGQIDREESATIPVSSGNVSKYPFDVYRLSVYVEARAGTGVGAVAGGKSVDLPFLVLGRNDAAGFDNSKAQPVPTHNGQVLNVRLWRSASTRGWVLAMMAMFWSIAIAAAAVAILVFLRERPWETRLLAWLAAMLFALVSLRAAAPGSPPIGTLFDAYAVFGSVTVVALALIGMTVYYAAASRGRLGL
jgi:Domain of unknown function (DUF4436)